MYGSQAKNRKDFGHEVWDYVFDHHPEVKEYLTRVRPDNIYSSEFNVCILGGGMGEWGEWGGTRGIYKESVTVVLDTQEVFLHERREIGKGDNINTRYGRLLDGRGSHTGFFQIPIATIYTEKTVIKFTIIIYVRHYYFYDCIITTIMIV